MDPVDFSQIQRIVFLIDLHPLHDLQNPNLYLSSILSAARRFLSFAPLCSSLFAYKFCFSSLSPVLSTSRVHRLLGKSPTFLSFDRPAQTLDSLSRVLDSLCSVADPSHFAGHGSPRALLLARSLLQLEHDYGWESLPQDRKGTMEFFAVRSNLVLLFCPVSQSLDCWLEHADLESSGECNPISTMTSDVFLERFVECFRLVKDRLVACDIHLSWVDVSCDYECKGEVSLSGFFEKGIRELGWGFCSTDAIALGSALVPFGLIFPYVGCTMSFEVDSSLKKGNSELVLEIVDVNEKPLKCKGCDLEVVDLKLVTGRLGIGSSLETFISKASKIHIKEIWMSDAETKVISNLNGIYVVRGVSGGCRKASQNHAKGEFFADRVIELLCREKGDFVAGQPVWQILLAFLYSRNYWASVSVSDNDDHSMEGILMPFTLNYALLAIAKKGYLKSGQLIARKSKLTCSELTEDHRRKRNKIHQNPIQNSTLSSIRELVFNQTADVVLGVDLEQLYFSRKYDKSKKLKFLKCWMKQIMKLNTGCQVVTDDLKEHLDVEVELETRTVASQDECNADVIPSSTGEACTSGSTNNGTPVFTSMEDVEAFLRSIPQKIEQGLCSQEADLGILTERLVGLSIRALDMKFRGNDKVIISNEAGDASYWKIADEVSRLFLTGPKDLTLKYKSMSSSCHASSTPASDYCSREYKIREHESQILFRMELLRSSIGINIEENMKQKMIKEICSLLQFIDINLQGDSFCSYSIVEYAERTIKNRYSYCLRDVICKIYNQMEFDLFDEDEVEASDSLPNNNEDLKMDNNKENYRFCENEAPCNEATQQEQHRQAKMDNMHEQRLIKAQERRNRDRRLSSFTSWMPDLKRVWARKQSKAGKMMYDTLPKPSKRRKRHLATDDRVCETPMTGRKEHAHVEEDRSSSGIRLKPLSKALFHHDLVNIHYDLTSHDTTSPLEPNSTSTVV